MGTHRAPRRTSRLGVVPSRWRGVAVAGVAALGLGSLVAASGAGTRAEISCATLSPGAAGPAVATVQRAVGVTVDGEYGPATKAAVEAWQHRHGVPQTGAVDPATWLALPKPVTWAACGQAVHGSGAATHCAHLERGSTGPAVAVLQARVGTAIDGGFGPDTERAVRHAQRSADLRPTGVVGPVTWAALHLTGTPVCLQSTTTSGGHDRAQDRVHRQVSRLATRLLEHPTRPASPLAMKALGFARSQLGKPYVFGAEGPRAYDCSGLTLAAYQYAGITIPRIAADQYAAGRPVPLDRARPGDLLFYASDVTRPATIHHVVIYAGRGRVLEAPKTGDVVKVIDLWTDGLLPVAARPVGLLDLPVKPGAKGETVAQLQRALDRHGAHLTVDGAYGPLSQAAARAWKRAHDRPGTAKFGRPAWLTLGSRPAG